MKIFKTEIFDSEYGFGGNGKPFLPATAAEHPSNLTGRTGGGLRSRWTIPPGHICSERQAP
jgi:hypothetical protein